MRTALVRRAIARVYPPLRVPLAALFVGLLLIVCERPATAANDVLWEMLLVRMPARSAQTVGIVNISPFSYTGPLEPDTYGSPTPPRGATRRGWLAPWRSFFSGYDVEATHRWLDAYSSASHIPQKQGENYSYEFHGSDDTIIVPPPAPNYVPCLVGGIIDAAGRWAQSSWMILNDELAIHFHAKAYRNFGEMEGHRDGLNLEAQVLWIRNNLLWTFTLAGPNYQCRTLDLWVTCGQRIVLKSTFIGNHLDTHATTWTCKNPP